MENSDISQRERTTREDQDEVLEEAVKFLGDRKGLTAEPDVSKGVMITTPTPPLPTTTTKMDI